MIPSLKERLDDLQLLVDHIIGQSSRKSGIKPPGLSSEALKMLTNYDWPGNVRELENVIERALLLCPGDTIMKEHFTIRSRRKTRIVQLESTTIDQGFKEMIKSALERCDGNVSQAAKELNIARSTLYRKMQQFDLVK